MINSKTIILKSQRGAAMLVMALVLTTLSMLIVIFAAHYGNLQSKAVTNITRNQQAMNAAQAGLEFGISYLNVNSATILASPVSGYLAPFSNSSTTNVTLSNGCKFSITYSNPTANNYKLIKITSVGSSDDGTAVTTVSQLVQFGSMLLNIPGSPMISLGSVTLSGNSEIVNVYSGTTIQTALGVSISGSATTTLASGTSSDKNGIKSDVQQNVASLQSLSHDDFFSTIFGLSTSSIKSSVGNYYTSSVTTDYASTLNGKTGTSIWIDQTGGTATLTSNATIGSAASPVILIINGPVRFQGNVTIYGYVFVTGTSTTDLLGNVTINGAMGTTDNTSASTGSVQVNYSPSVLGNLQNVNGLKYYAKVPGSWKEF
jgi:Tfp pilus assembly protein PilX